eukprot:gnl/Ergobibamus_cyprinoides/3679.p2 GENE.gnl/Ergobibamus_cyprinoides/3679~~gnl/Ergobibamus_cyprinoides/3679.p2  ORF type:complete len:287 (+),score=79.47 gnl/Ergobibamus_cyprinoides/3679:56-862(+)
MAPVTQQTLEKTILRESNETLRRQLADACSRLQKADEAVEAARSRAAAVDDALALCKADLKLATARAAASDAEVAGLHDRVATLSDRFGGVDAEEHSRVLVELRTCRAESAAALTEAEDAKTALAAASKEAESQNEARLRAESQTKIDELAAKLAAATNRATAAEKQLVAETRIVRAQLSRAALISRAALRVVDGQRSAIAQLVPELHDPAAAVETGDTLAADAAGTAAAEAGPDPEAPAPREAGTKAPSPSSEADAPPSKRSNATEE